MERIKGIFTTNPFNPLTIPAPSWCFSPAVLSPLVKPASLGTPTGCKIRDLQTPCQTFQDVPLFETRFKSFSVSQIPW